jgi:hypothetical protein
MVACKTGTTMVMGLTAGITVGKVRAVRAERPDKIELPAAFRRKLFSLGQMPGQ